MPSENPEGIFILNISRHFSVDYLCACTADQRAIVISWIASLFTDSANLSPNLALMPIRNLVALLLFISILFASGAAECQRVVQQALPGKTRILFVLDASGSMNAQWGNEQSRMDVAKAILTRLVDSLRANPNLELALRVYGHRYSRQANNCNDSKLEVPFGVKNHDVIIKTITGLTPRGVTPITYSLIEAGKDFPQSPGYRNILILITDGVESCGGAKIVLPEDFHGDLIVGAELIIARCADRAHNSRRRTGRSLRVCRGAR